MRGLIAGILIVVALVLVPFATVGLWMRRQILPTDAFTDLATEVVQEDAVSDALASRLVDEIVDQQPQLGIGRFALEPAVREALDTPQFEQIFRVSVGDMHAQLLRGDDQLSLNLEALVPIVRGFVAEIDEGIASQIPDSFGLPPITVVRKDNIPQLWFGVEVTREASWVFPVLLVLVLAAAVAVARQHALTLTIGGFGVAFVCLIVALALRTGRDLLSDYVGSEVDVGAFNAGYDVVTNSLVTQTLLLGLVALVAGAVGVALLVYRRSSTRPTGWA